MPYLGEFAELERQVGQVSVEIEERCLALADLAEVGTDQLPDIVLQLQPGIRYRKASWPIDDLLKLYRRNRPRTATRLNLAMCGSKSAALAVSFKLIGLNYPNLPFAIPLRKGDPLGQRPRAPWKATRLSTRAQLL